ncbi:MAG: bifunctional folylpolyglutamate synthase/dihydrofolate synthase [Alphaproteobacteria bacterium]|nr:bifunctional folylpolyglutamate synthase/dihydrofolate synthase [Alphaproteobacteria bacterium]MCB9692721.1 bifunctional folylpolyglutamate synthase/dihydrofolate synthase [Alphaproteobacteria bacterium]
MITHPVLSRLAMTGIRLGLDRVREFLTVLGEPHLKYGVVHVGGTNGKGSTVAMVARSLQAAGYRVGANHSPHTSEVNERIVIDGAPIDDAFLSACIGEVERARDAWALTAGIDGEPLTYFEFITCVAFVAFARAGVDMAVIEVGLGGRLDATNVVQPVVTAVASVSFDHMDVLGDTLAAIAGEKAGIFKKGVPAVIGPMEPSANEVFVRHARVLGVDLWKPGSDLRRARSGEGWDLSTPDGDLHVVLGLQGEHQGANASVALGILHLLRRQGFPVPDEAIVEGFRAAWMPGRLEEPLPGLLVDGAHNEAGALALARFLAKRPRPEVRILLWGMGEGRDPLSIVAPILPHVDELVTTRCAHPKARDPYDLAVLLQDAEVVLSAGGPVEETLPEVWWEADEVVVAGSLYLAGAVRDLVASGALDEEPAPADDEEGLEPDDEP